ncbi:MAG: hypothetical protein IKS49_03815 [Actinomycetaceae bacterium]|nr:hypothetical protein [Actinomycetaceae bacterium]
MSEFSYFASALNDAITSSNLSMEYIVRTLKKQGLPVSQGTLSHWRSGLARPTRKTTVKRLEEILQLPRGTLSELLEKDKGQRPNSFTSNLPDNDYSNTEALHEKIKKATEWDEEVSREVMIERTIISEDFLRCEHDILFLLRPYARTIEPQMHVRVFGFPGEFSNKTFGLLEGVEGTSRITKDIQINDDTEIHTFHLHLPEDNPSELYRIAYKQYQTLPPEQPFTESNRRLFAWQTKLYAGTLEFKGETPDVIEWVTESVSKSANDDSATSSITRHIEPVGNIASIVISNPPYGQGYWQWR